MLEKEIEKKLISQAKQRFGKAYKFVSPGNSGSTRQDHSSSGSEDWFFVSSRDLGQNILSCKTSRLKN